MSHTLLSAGAGRLSLWLGGAALAFGMFVRITRELIEGDVGAMDSAILLAVAKKRSDSIGAGGGTVPIPTPRMIQHCEVLAAPGYTCGVERPEAEEPGNGYMTPNAGVLQGRQCSLTNRRR